MLLKREKGKMPLPAKQPREPLFTTCVKRGRNGSFYFKNLFLDPFRGLEKRDFPGYRPAPGIRVGIRPRGWLRGARVVGAAVFPLLTSPIYRRQTDLPQQIVGVIWQDSVPDHDFQKETEDIQRKMIRFGSVLRMSVRRPLFVGVLNGGSTLTGGIILVGCCQGY